MKVQENVTLFKCDHCGKKMQRRHAMELHEKYCSRNPVNIAKCSGCVHLKEIKVCYEVDVNYGFCENGTETRQANGFFCEKKQQKLYPIKAARVGLVAKYPETFADQEPMPSECEYFECFT